MTNIVPVTIGVFGVILVVLLLSRSTIRGRTLRSFFWGDRSLKSWQSAGLLLATSLSLNGLLYQSFLGFKVGIWSAIIQLVWCAGFLFIAVNASRFFFLSQDTLHGQFRRLYGSKAGVIAAIASFTGFACFAGWEFSIAASLVVNFLHVTGYQIIFGILLLSIIPSLYSIRGGLRGNANLNIVLNGIASVFIICIIIFLFSDYVRTGAIYLAHESLISRLKLPVGDAILGLGGPALVSNLIFSFAWQSVDMSTWESVSGSARSPTDVARSLKLGAALVFIAPGLFGALLGIVLQHVPGVDADNILVVLANELASNPILEGLLFASLLAVMLSTLDAHFLSAALSVTADVFFL